MSNDTLGRSHTRAGHRMHTLTSNCVCRSRSSCNASLASDNILLGWKSTDVRDTRTGFSSFTLHKRDAVGVSARKRLCTLNYTGEGGINMSSGVFILFIMPGMQCPRGRWQTPLQGLMLSGVLRED